jgi:hypothetical protein
MYLGRPDLAQTYVDLVQQRVAVVPFFDLRHDYAYSEDMSNHGLSNGQIVTHQERDTGITYGLYDDLIPMGELIAASLNTQIGLERAQQNLHKTFDRIGMALIEAHQLTGQLPRDLTIDSIAIPRSNKGRVEFMPPYLATTELSPVDLIRNMRDEVRERSVYAEGNTAPDLDITPGMRDMLSDHLGGLALRIQTGIIES